MFLNQNLSLTNYLKNGFKRKNKVTEKLKRK
jgi:hypothetical protein